MTRFEQQKIIQTVLYILNKTGGIDYYHIFKILYFAESKHLAKWGQRIISDDFYALDYGPVPTHLYDAVKGNDTSHPYLVDQLQASTAFAGNDAPNVLLPKEPVNMNYISESEREALDESIEENSGLTFGQLKNKSHDKAWYEAYHFVNGTKCISPVTMAEAMNADSATIEYIKDQQELDSALS